MRHFFPHFEGFVQNEPVFRSVSVAVVCDANGMVPTLGVFARFIISDVMVAARNLLSQEVGHV